MALGAHYDHVGVTTRSGDRIYNGADDDGSGTTALLAMAEALGRGQVKTKRSVLFVWHAGEEQGLLGARYFTSWPTVPLERIVAQLNVDMIGRSRASGDQRPANASLTGPDEVYVIGSKMMSSELGELSERVNRQYLNLSFNYKYDDPGDPERFFFRSDHYQLRAAEHPDHLLLLGGARGLPSGVGRSRAHRLREDGEGRAHDLRDRAGAGRRADAAGRRSEAARGDDRTLNSYQRPVTSDQLPGPGTDRRPGTPEQLKSENGQP